jgi:hypothetical protein
VKFFWAERCCCFLTDLYLVMRMYNGGQLARITHNPDGNDAADDMMAVGPML